MVLNAVCSAAVLLALALAVHLNQHISLNTRANEPLDIRLAVVGLGLIGLAGLGAVLLLEAKPTWSFHRQHQILGVLLIVLGLASAATCLGVMVQRRRRHHN